MGYTHSITCPLVPISSPMMPMIDLSLFLSFLGLAPKAFYPVHSSSKDMMTVTALEVIASSNSKNNTRAKSEQQGNGIFTDIIAIDVACMYVSICNIFERPTDYWSKTGCKRNQWRISQLRCLSEYPNDAWVSRELVN